MEALLGVRAGAARDIVVYWIALLLVVGITPSIYVFVRSRLGLGLAASRDNNGAARSVGVRTHRIRYLLWELLAVSRKLKGRYSVIGEPMLLSRDAGAGRSFAVRRQRRALEESTIFRASFQSPAGKLIFHPRNLTAS